MEWATRNPIRLGKEPPAVSIDEGSDDLAFVPAAVPTLGKVIGRRAFGARQESVTASFI